MPTCPRCQCQGHGQTYVATRSVCGEVKYPTLAEPPGPGWICALCRATPVETRSARREASARAQATKRAQGRPGTAGGPEAA